MKADFCEGQAKLARRPEARAEHVRELHEAGEANLPALSNRRTSSLSRRTLFAAPALLISRAVQAASPWNVLMITADDMNWDTPGAFGGKVADITPNIDRLASEGMRFLRAHVTVAVCQPSRSVWMTGRYPHRNGAEGFQPIRPDVPTLQERLHPAGYLNGIMGKTEHLAPREKFCWDSFVTAAELGQGRDPQLYYHHAKAFFQKAKAEGKPFFLMANSHDPHRPFAGSAQELKAFKKHLDFTRQIKPEEAVVPGFLPDIPDVRKEVAEYLTSAHRCDQTVGQLLRALRESGFDSNTIVMFLSDNGMAFPFAKTNCYLNSTRTPWIVRWPGVVKPRSVDRDHFISGIDFTPTVLDALGLPPLPDVDGKSFVSLLKGGSDPGRDRVITVFHETSARQRYEMRCIQNRRYGYIFNAWSDGKRVFRNESQSGLTFNAMKAAAESDKAIAERVRMFLYRTPEEFYDFESDPDALDNLIAQPSLRKEIGHLRRELLAWMQAKGDPLEPIFRKHLS